MMPEWFEKGGPVMYPLLACSFISAVILIERVLYFAVELLQRKDKKLKEILAITASGKSEQAQEEVNKCNDFAAPVLECGLKAPAAAVSLAMEACATKQIEKCERFLTILQTIITLAPLLGILGTVTGIIHAFEVLGASAIADPKGVTSGVAEALITTAFGLTIAIFTLIPYTFFSRHIDKIKSRVEVYATQLEMIHLKK